jgi:hypothetical protein
MGLYLSTSSTFLSDPSPLIWCDYASLAAGASTTCSGSASLPADMQPGSYYLVAAADVLNQLVQFYQYRSVRLSDSGLLVVQSGTCTYSLSGSGVQVAGGGGSSSFTVGTQAGCSWTAASNANWIAITSGASGNGAGQVTLNVASNPGPGRAGAVSVAGQQFTVGQGGFTGASITLQFTNFLVYPASVSVNGAVVGTVNASSSASWTIPAPATLQVSFQLIQPSPWGVPLGDPMAGSFSPVNSPQGTYSFNITNQIGNQTYFVPFVTNTTNSALLMDVNLGLPQENKCNCLAPPQGVNIAFGYYMLFSNSNVDAFPAGSGYSGNFLSFNNFNSSVENQTGIVMLTVNQSP